MSILTLFVVIPVLMLSGLWLSRNLNQVRGVMVVGSSCLLALSIWLTLAFIQARQAGDTSEMLFTYSTPWFRPLNIAYSVGVDGISVVMLLLSAVIVFTGTFASWQLKPLTKEYFLWFTLLSTGVFGFFICTDLFTMFMFYEVALIPMYLLIGVWGSGNKEYAAMKLTLMLMGGSALLIIGILGIYFFSGATTMNVNEIAAMHNIAPEVQKVFFPFPIIAIYAFHNSKGRPGRFFVFLAISYFLGMMLAMGTELIQGTTDYRSSDMLDLVADSLGLMTGCVTVTVIKSFGGKW